MLSNVQFSCFLLSYLVALVLEIVSSLRGSKVARLSAIGLAIAGIVAHSAYLIVRSRAANLPPLLSSTQDWLLVLAWLGVIFHLVIVALDRDLPIGLFLFPVVLGLIGFAYFAHDEPHSLIADVAKKTAERKWVMLHASSLVVGCGGVLLGFVLSLMYLIQHRRLRSKLGGVSTVPLPNLEKLAKLNWWVVVVAVPLLTIGFVAGIIVGQLEETATEFSMTDPTVIVNTIVWIIMAGLFYRLLRRREVSGKTVAWQTIWAFGFLIATIIGLELLTGDGKLSSFHGAAAKQEQSSGGDGA